VRANRRDLERVADIPPSWNSPQPFAPENALEADPLAARVVTGLAKIGLATRHRAWTEGQGLTPLQGQILALLRQQCANGMGLSAIAKALAITAPTASLAVQALERKQLVRKTRAADDARVRVITLTETGQQEALRAASWSDFLLTAVNALTPTEQEIFLRGLVKMIATLQERSEIPISRMCVSCIHFRPNAHPDPARPHHCAFVDAPFGDRSLRLDCADHEPASPDQMKHARFWETEAAGG
jgi:DNA-binding MarR family transcriptional regulator